MALGCARIRKFNSIFPPLSHDHVLQIFWECVWEGLPVNSFCFLQTSVCLQTMIFFFFGASINKVYLTNLCWMAEQSGKTVCHLRTAIIEFHQPQWGKMLSALLENLLPSPQQRFIFTLSTEYLCKYLSSCSSLLL